LGRKTKKKQRGQLQRPKGRKEKRGQESPPVSQDSEMERKTGSSPHREIGVWIKKESWEKMIDPKFKEKKKKKRKARIKREGGGGKKGTDFKKKSTGKKHFWGGAGHLNVLSRKRRGSRGGKSFRKEPLSNAKKVPPFPALSTITGSRGSWLTHFSRKQRSVWGSERRGEVG